MHDLQSWPRRSYTGNVGAPAPVWVVLGSFQPLRLDSAQYRTQGLPDGMQMLKVLKGQRGFPDHVFQATWAEMANQDHPGLLAQAREAPEAWLLEGTVQDGTSLDYLRDLIGLVACLFDRGARAVVDVLAFKWWDRESFLHQLWMPRRPMPFQHVTILASPRPDGLLWVHTRGMRLFGRPDVSVPRVEPADVERVTEALNDLIVLFTEGGWLPDGSALAGTARLRGGLEDPGFHNTYLEVVR